MINCLVHHLFIDKTKANFIRLVVHNVRHVVYVRCAAHIIEQTKQHSPKNEASLFSIPSLSKCPSFVSRCAGSGGIHTDSPGVALASSASKLGQNGC